MDKLSLEAAAPQRNTMQHSPPSTADSDTKSRQPKKAKYSLKKIVDYNSKINNISGSKKPGDTSIFRSFRTQSWSRHKKDIFTWAGGKQHNPPSWANQQIASDIDLGMFYSPKKRSLKEAETYMENKIRGRFMNKGIDSETVKVYLSGLKICLRALQRVHDMAPDDMRQILNPWTRTWYTPGIYCIGKGPSQPPKVGESGNLQKRVVKKDGPSSDDDDDDDEDIGQVPADYGQVPADYTGKYVILHSEDSILSGLIDKDHIDQLYNLRLLIFRGMHTDREPLIKDKITRQLVEGIISSIYEVNDGPIFEFLFKVPTKDMEWVADILTAFNNIDNLGQEDLVRLTDWMSVINTIYMFKTWPTISSDLHNLPGKPLEYFLREQPNSEFLKRFINMMAYDATFGNEWSDPYPVSPFSEKIIPILTEIEDILQDKSPDVERINVLLKSMPVDDYIHPGPIPYANRSMEHIKDKLQQLKETTLLLMEFSTYSNLEKQEATKHWFKDVFPSDNKIVIRGSENRLRRKEDGQGERKVTNVTSQGLVVHKTSCGHIVLVRQSAFLSHAVSVKYPHRFNALRGLLDEGVFMYACGFLSAEQLLRLQQFILTSVMILVGVKNSITRPSGGPRELCSYTCEGGMCVGGLISGSTSLTKVFGQIPKVNYYALLLMLSRFGVTNTNKLLDLLNESGDVRIDTLQSINNETKYVLKVKTRQASSTETSAISTGDTRTIWHRHLDRNTKYLEQSFTYLKVLNDQGEDTKTHTIITDFIRELFTYCDLTNDPAESRIFRLREFISFIGKKADLDEKKKKKLLLTITDDLFINGPIEWMDTFNRIRQYKERVWDTKPSKGKVFIITMEEQDDYTLDVLKYFLRWLKEQTGAYDTLCGTSQPVSGLRKIMLEEIDVPFEKEDVTNAKQRSVEENFAKHLAKLEAGEGRGGRGRGGRGRGGRGR